MQELFWIRAGIALITSPYMVPQALSGHAEEEIKPAATVLMGVSSSSHNEANAPSSPFLTGDYRQYQELLRRPVTELQIPLEEVHDAQCRLLEGSHFGAREALLRPSPEQGRKAELGSTERGRVPVHPPSAELIGGTGSQRAVRMAIPQASSI